MNESRLQTIITVIPVLSAGLYLIGASYHQGYLSAFGLNDSLFTLATDKALLSGFFSLVSLGLMPTAYVVLALLALTFAGIVAGVLSSSHRVKCLQSLLLGKLTDWLKRTKPSEVVLNFVDKSTTAGIYISGIIIAILMLVFLAAASEKSGIEMAGKEITNFKNLKGSYSILHSPQFPSPTRTLLIICSQTHCAFWLGEETVLLRHESIERVVAHNPSFLETLSPHPNSPPR